MKISNIKQLLPCFIRSFRSIFFTCKSRFKGEKATGEMPRKNTLIIILYYLKPIIKRFLHYHTVVTIVTLILIIVLSDRKLIFLWVLIFIVCKQVVLLLLKLIGARVRQRYKRAEYIAYKRLEFIRQIAELTYLHSYNTDVFYRKIYKIMHLEELKKKSVVDFNFELEKHIILKNTDNLSKDDAEFYCLIKNGFSTRELSIIFGHGNPKSIYVKKCRLMKKLSRKKVVRKGLSIA